MGWHYVCFHHRAFDDGLIFIDDEYRVYRNSDRINYLEKTDQIIGLAKFEATLRNDLLLPSRRKITPVQKILRSVISSGGSRTGEIAASYRPLEGHFFGH